MPNFTPQQIVDALHEADKQLELLADQFAWLKGQKDYWHGELSVRLASASVHDKGPTTKHKEAALHEVSQIDVEIPWQPGCIVSLPQFVLLCDASFDLISKRYARLESHIMILQSVNKNVMQDYQRADGWG